MTITEWVLATLSAGLLALITLLLGICAREVRRRSRADGRLLSVQLYANAIRRAGTHDGKPLGEEAKAVLLRVEQFMESPFLPDEGQP